MGEAISAAFRRILEEIRSRLSAVEDGDPAVPYLRELESDPVLYNFEHRGIASLAGLRSWGRFVDDQVKLHGEFAATFREAQREDGAQLHNRVADALRGLSDIALGEVEE
jgi:hypothetical protein